MTIYTIIIIISIIFLFFIINNFVLYKKEHFMKLKSGRVCGEFNDTCRLNQYNVSSCCKGYYCGLKLGKFRSKVCIPIKNIANATSLTSLQNNPLGIINLPDEATGSDKTQIQDANMGSEVTEEESEELYYQLFLNLVSNISVIVVGSVYEYNVKNETEKDRTPLARYQDIYTMFFNLITNYIINAYSVNKPGRKNVKAVYLTIANHSTFLDQTKIDNYRKLFNL